MQKLFDTVSNGRLTIDTGLYEFECVMHLQSMSTTSGNLSFDVRGAGTASLTGQLFDAYGRDAVNANFNSLGSMTGTANNSSNSIGAPNIVTAATAGQLFARINGIFRCTSAGTIIPSVALTTAAAAEVLQGTYFRIRRLGGPTEYTKGSWD